MKIDISYRRILQLTAPVAVTSATHSTMGVIDTIMVGRLGVTALAGVGLAVLFSWWGLSFFYGLLQGVNTFVAQFFGAGRRDRVGVAFWQGLYIAAGAGALMLAAAPLARFVFSWTGASPEVQAIATSYTEIRVGAAVGFFAFLVAENYFRGLGRTEVPMYAGLLQLVLNCGLNYLFIFGAFGFPQMGAPGAAVGTAIAQVVVAAGLILGVVLTATGRRYGAATVRALDFPLLGRMLRVSVPIGLQVFMELGGIMIFTALVARLGDAEMAATNAAVQLWSLAFTVAYALAAGTTTLVGQSLGARQPDEARLAIRRLLRIGYVAMAACGLVFIGFPNQLIAVFLPEPDQLALVLPYAQPLLLIAAICLIFEFQFNLLMGALRGAGDTTYCMIVNIGAVWLVFVPLLFVATTHWGLIGAWSCFVVHVALMAGLLALRVRGRVWIERGMALLDAERPEGLPHHPIEVEELRSSPAV